MGLMYVVDEPPKRLKVLTKGSRGILEVLMEKPTHGDLCFIITLTESVLHHLRQLLVHGTSEFTSTV